MNFSDAPVWKMSEGKGLPAWGYATTVLPKAKRFLPGQVSKRFDGRRGQYAVEY